jgi:hypothetical protein
MRFHRTLGPGMLWGITPNVSLAPRTLTRYVPYPLVKVVPRPKFNDDSESEVLVVAPVAVLSHCHPLLNTQHLYLRTFILPPTLS